MGSAGFFIAGMVILALVAAGVGFYLYQRKGNGDTARLFAPRLRRLAFVERTALEGGRKLLLVRRDDVEHLVLIGGSIDLIVESGIRSEAATAAFAKQAGSAQASAMSSVWPLSDFVSDVEPVVAPEPQFSVFPKAKDGEKPAVLTPMREAKAAE